MAKLYGRKSNQQVLLIPESAHSKHYCIYTILLAETVVANAHVL
jgi:hypothetical protein